MFNIGYNPFLMSDDVFGRNYVGSNKWRQNQRKRKQLAKRK